MANKEIDETELMNYQQLASAMQKMLSKPEARKLLLQAQKLANPEAVIPELDALKPVQEAISEVKKEADEVRQQLKKEREDRDNEKALDAMRSKWEKGRSAARSAGYTEEGLQKLEKFMEENVIADHKLAMPAFERLNPPEAPVESSTSNFDLLRKLPKDSEDTKSLFEGDFEGFTAKRIKETLTDIRSGGR